MKCLLIAFLIATAAPIAYAQVTVKDPWVRATVPQQKATGAFMQITSTRDARLVEVRSPVTLVIEGKDGKRETIEVKAPAKPLATPSGGSMKK